MKRYHSLNIRQAMVVAAILAFLCGASGLASKAFAANPAAPQEKAPVLKLPALIGSGMVLQRDQEVPIWGTAPAEQAVIVKIGRQTKTAVADADGKWMVRLSPMKAGGPFEMTVSCGEKQIIITDVLVGEVWVGSGQSNMIMGVPSYTNNDPVLAEAAASTYPNLRLFKSSGWGEANPTKINRFSALLFSFGVRLQKELDVPVGLMVGAVGGTPSGHWLSEDAFNADAACKEVIAEFAKTYSFSKAQVKYQQDMESWKKAVAEAGTNKPPREPSTPLMAGECRGKIGNLYEAYIRPFIPYGIRGVLWDQGEGGTAILGLDQYTLMGALIRGWRKEWGQGDFPFLYVQKPSGLGCAWDLADPVTKEGGKVVALPPTPPGDGLYRDNHIRIMQYPKTHMVISSDLGAGIHPINKSGYGARAARVALGAVYNRKIEFYGPMYQSHKVDGDKVRISYSHVGKGLAVCTGTSSADSTNAAPFDPQGFAVAGEDMVFHWGKAAIDGKTVVVFCEKVPKPVAVRYGWGSNNTWANLFNKDGLPALPFRTDAW